MIRSSCLAFVLGVVFAATAATRASVAEPLPLSQARKVELGHAIVDRNCGMCHATGLTGSSPNPEAPPFRLLHQRIDVDDLSEALAEGIMTGHEAMPEFRFEPREVDAIVTYLKSIQTRTRV
jgi:cytochrome c